MRAVGAKASVRRGGLGRLLHALGRQRARLALLGVVACYFALLVAVGGHSEWGRLGVGPLRYRFGDLRNLTSAWECVREHIHVQTTNPCDPDNRPADYPGIMLLPAHLGLGSGDTIALGWSLFAVYLAAAVAVLPARARISTTALYALALCSPAAMLGVERGNIDLTLFSLIAVAVLVAQRGRRGRSLSAALVLLAGVMKLFPVLAVGFLGRGGSRRALATVGAVLAAFAVYALVIHRQLQQINALLPQSDKYSYGLRRVSEWLSAGLEGHSARSASLPSWDVLLALAIAAAAWFSARRLQGTVSFGGAAESERDLDLFWAGACVYVGSYLLARNYDYRLVFLLPTVPQLARWASARSKLAYLTLAALLGTTWLDAGPFEWSWLRSLLDGWSSWTATGPHGPDAAALGDLAVRALLLARRVAVRDRALAVWAAAQAAESRGAGRRRLTRSAASGGPCRGAGGSSAPETGGEGGGQGREQQRDEGHEHDPLRDHHDRKRKGAAADRGHPVPPVERDPHTRHPRPLVQPHDHEQGGDRDRGEPVALLRPAGELGHGQQAEDQPVVVAAEDGIRADVDARSDPEEVELAVGLAVVRARPQSPPPPAQQPPCRERRADERRVPAVKRAERVQSGLRGDREPLARPPHAVGERVRGRDRPQHLVQVAEARQPVDDEARPPRAAPPPPPGGWRGGAGSRARGSGRASGSPRTARARRRSALRAPNASPQAPPRARSGTAPGRGSHAPPRASRRASRAGARTAPPP